MALFKLSVQPYKFLVNNWKFLFQTHQCDLPDHIDLYSSQKRPKLPILVNFWSGGQTKFVNISNLKKILKLLVSKNWIFINQNRCFCSCWNHLFEQNSKMPKIGSEGVKNSALWQLALIYWTNPTDSMPKMI